MSDIFGKWQVGELLAVMWDEEMAQRFPDMNHALCRVQVNEQGQVMRCMGWHCNRCGSPTNSYGHHDCPDRPTTNREKP